MKVSDAAIRINRIVMEEFLKVRLPVISFAPKSFIFGQGIMRRKEVLEQPLMESSKNRLDTCSIWGCGYGY